MNENFVFSTVTMLETKNNPEIRRPDPDPVYEKRRVRYKNIFIIRS